MPEWTTDVGDRIASSLLFDEPSNSCWLGTADGRIVTVRVLGLTVSERGTGWSELVAACPSADGNGIVVVTRTAVWLAPLGNATPAAAEQLIAFADDALAAARTVDGVLLVLDAAGAVSTVPTKAGGQIKPLVSPVDGAAFAVDDVRGTLHVAAAEAGGTRVETFDLVTGEDLGIPVDLTVELVAIGGPPAVSPAASVLGADTTGILGVHLLDGSSNRAAFGARRGRCREVALACLHGGGLGAAARRVGARARRPAGDDRPRPARPPRLGRDRRRLRGCRPRPRRGRVGGPRGDGDGHPLAGGRHGAGRHGGRASRPGRRDRRRVPRRRARCRASGEVLATARFRVVDLWPDTVLGPSRAVTGFQQVFAKGGWGGGPGGPQNIAASPAPEEFRVAVILVRTKGSTSKVNGDARRDKFKEHMIGSKSVRDYYEEVSFRSASGTPGSGQPKGTTVKLFHDTVFGPIDVPYTWTELFTMDEPGNPWASWSPTGRAWEAFGGGFSAQVNSLGIPEAVLRRSTRWMSAVLPASGRPGEGRHRHAFGAVVVGLRQSS